MRWINVLHWGLSVVYFMVFLYIPGSSPFCIRCLIVAQPCLELWQQCTLHSHCVVPTASKDQASQSRVQLSLIQTANMDSCSQPTDCGVNSVGSTQGHSPAQWPSSPRV